jgi:hypothetical protein
MGLSSDGITALSYAAVGPSRWCLVAEINLESEGNNLRFVLQLKEKNTKNPGRIVKVAQLVKKFPTFDEGEMFITVFV